jgi:hypothetical protein
MPYIGLPTIIRAMPKNDESQPTLIRRAAWSGLAVLTGWGLYKGLDLGVGAEWRSLDNAGGWPLALGAMIFVVATMSIALGAAAGRITLPLTRFRIWGSWTIRHLPYALRDFLSRQKVAQGVGNARWASTAEFEQENPRRIGCPDQLHSDFGHWRQKGVKGSCRVSFIHATGELVAVTLATESQPVELLGYARDDHDAQAMLKDWAYVHPLWWARYRCRGWNVPLPPRARWWKEFDQRPPRAWPTPPPPSVGRAVGAYHGHSESLENSVSVVDEEGSRALYHAVDSSPTGLAWGYGGAGPTDMSRSLMLDRLGYVPQPGVVSAFRDDIIARLQPHFVLTFEEVDDWIDAHTLLFADDPRAEPLDPYAAGGAD